MKSQDLEKFKLPDTPGVYFFRLGQEILYIGKATSLKQRTKSYFSKDLIKTRGPMIVDMVFRADTITYQETDTVIEALILEAALIKKHLPYYNVKEKDDKSWNYAVITKGTPSASLRAGLPQVLTIRGRDLEKYKAGTPPPMLEGIKIDKMYGPFTSGAQFKEAMKIIRRIFPYIDASSAKRDNYEFYRQLGLTPDVSDEDACKAYKRNIKNIERFFEGKKGTILRELEKEMMMLAKTKEFEQADVVKRRIFALKHINDIALIKDDMKDTPAGTRPRGFRIEAYDVAHLGGKNMVGVMTVIEDGEISKKEYRTFNIRGFAAANDTGALEELLSRRLRHSEWGMPDIIITDGGAAQFAVAQRVLSRYQLKVPVLSVVKDERHKPKEILGDTDLSTRYKKDILLANSEAHRFSIRLHKNKRDKNFLGK